MLTSTECRMLLKTVVYTIQKLTLIQIEPQTLYYLYQTESEKVYV